MACKHDVTELLHRIRAGDRDAEIKLIERLDRDFRVIAARRMRREPSDHTWQATELVNEALIRLKAEGTFATASDRTFLFKAASRAMYQLLIDHHRRRRAGKRGRGWRKHPLDAALDHLANDLRLPLLELRNELEQLARLDERAAMVVNLRFFLGLTPTEVAESLSVSLATVERDWRFARTWLHDRL